MHMFSEFWKLYSPHMSTNQNKGSKLPITLENFLVSFPSIPISQRQGLSDFYHHRALLSVLGWHANKIIQYSLHLCLFHLIWCFKACTCCCIYSFYWRVVLLIWFHTSTAYSPIGKDFVAFSFWPPWIRLLFVLWEPSCTNLWVTYALILRME